MRRRRVVLHAALGGGALAGALGAAWLGGGGELYVIAPVVALLVYAGVVVALRWRGRPRGRPHENGEGPER